MYGLDAGMLLYVVFYSALTLLCIVAGVTRIYKNLKKKKKPNLILIQGGKKDKGPFGDKDDYI